MFANIGPVQLGIILLIVIAIFGTRRFRDAGGDLGAMFKGIRDGFSGDDTPKLSDVAKEVRGIKDELKETEKELHW